MFLHKDDIIRIQEILKKFPDVNVFELESDNSSGIGSHTTMKFYHEVNGIEGEFTVTVSNVENW